MILCLLLPIITGCSGSKSLRFDARYKANLGISTTRDFYNESIPILHRHNYLIEKSEEYGTTYYIETRWSASPPFTDEEEIGVLQARTRIILRAKARQVASRSNVVRRLNQVVLTAENEVTFGEDDKGHKIPLTDMRKEYFRRIADELKMEFNIGLRIV